MFAYLFKQFVSIIKTVCGSSSCSKYPANKAVIEVVCDLWMPESLAVSNTWRNAARRCCSWKRSSCSPSPYLKHTILTLLCPQFIYWTNNNCSFKCWSFEKSQLLSWIFKKLVVESYRSPFMPVKDENKVNNYNNTKKQSQNFKTHSHTFYFL